MANDRHYDINKYDTLATTLCNKIDELRSDVDLLRSYYNNAAELKFANLKYSHDKTLSYIYSMPADATLHIPWLML